MFTIGLFVSPDRPVVTENEIKPKNTHKRFKRLLRVNCNRAAEDARWDDLGSNIVAFVQTVYRTVWVIKMPVLLNNRPNFG